MHVVAMTEVEIEYCVPCGFLPRAERIQHRLLEDHGRTLERVALVTGDHGVFVVSVDGETVFDKETDEYDEEAIVEAVGSGLETAA